MAKQIKFKELCEGNEIGGIMLDNGDVVCGCCGSIFPMYEKGKTWELVEDYGDCWVDISAEIIGT